MKSRALIMAGCLFALGIASCGPKTETPSTTDSSAVKTDTMPKPNDSVPVTPVDTAKKPSDTMVLKPNDSLKHTDSVKKSGTTSTPKETKPAVKSSGSKSTGTGTNTGTGGTPSGESKPRRSSGGVLNTNPPANGGGVGESKPRR